MGWDCETSLGESGPPLSSDVLVSGDAIVSGVPAIGNGSSSRSSYNTGRT